MNIRKHASIRMQERCSLSENELKNLLQSGKYYPIGRDDIKRHEHKMIYSELDNEFLVVVEDYDNHDIITILTLDYHNAWTLPPELLEIAQNSLLPKPKEKVKTNNATNVIIIANVYTTVVHKKIDSFVKRTNCNSIKVGKLSISELISHGYSEGLALNVDNFKDEFLNNVLFRNGIKGYILREGASTGAINFLDEAITLGYSFNVGGFSFSTDSNLNIKSKTS